MHRPLQSAEPDEAHLLHTTISGKEVKNLYTAGDLKSFDPAEQLGLPGKPPFTRGVHPEMYRQRLWTMRQFAGFGTARDTNERFKMLLEKGVTGLSTAFDLPTLMGVDSDDPRALGEVGRLGVAVDTLDDMLELFDGINLGDVSVSMTINAPAIIVMACYLLVAEEEGVEFSKLRGTIQNDILKEFHAQNEYVFPPEPSVNLVVDVIEYCAKHVPQFNPVSISGYHIREAGSTAAQELAFTLADGLEYARLGVARGLAIDSFAPRLSFFFNAHNEFFEEIAKYRAARRIWCRHMLGPYGAKDERSAKLRFHAQTAGCSLHAQQPYCNLMRVAYQAMAAVLGGCQSLHTNSMDETLSLPTENAVTLALRTQQVLAYETGVVNCVDPLGGSYYIEKLTDELEGEAEGYFKEIEKLGGMIPALNKGFFRNHIVEAASRYQREVDNQQRILVGVNDFVEEEEEPIDTLVIDPEVETRQLQRLRKVKTARDARNLTVALQGVREAAKAGKNMMEPIMSAARARATVGEMMKAMEDVYGRFKPPAGW